MSGRSAYSSRSLSCSSHQARQMRRPRIRPLPAYNDFFTLWKDADPDIRILKSQSGVREAAIAKR